MTNGRSEGGIFQPRKMRLPENFDLIKNNFRPFANFMTRINRR